jgi:hypothetical protein
MTISRTYQVTLATTATLIAWYAKDRSSIMIRNDSGSTVYISPDASITTTNGQTLPTGIARTWQSKEGDVVCQPFYGIVASNTAVVTIEEDLDWDGED